MSFLKKVEEKFKEVEDGIGDLLAGDHKSGDHKSDSQHGGGAGGGGGGGGGGSQAAHATQHSSNRFQSFAPQTTGQAKWYVDGCSYFWAVSEALEQARESIYILDWWLSPEIYLRRPPAANEKYRLDNMLKAAAERGVKVRVIVYKEVPAVLTCDSAHSKHALEALHDNIKVFRHPDHYPSGYDIQAELASSFKKMSLQTFDLAQAGQDALKTLYGTSDDVVLYWAHHEKLCIVDNKIAFMGGLDMCFGRWDTNSHPIADAHPGNLDAIIFPGQDFNNARVYDFDGVENWDQNKLDRTKSSRMGWSDISISLSGPIVDNLLNHFVDRWNYIFDQKYTSKDKGKYTKITSQRSTHEANRSHGMLGGGGEDLLGGISERFNRGMSRLAGDNDEQSRESRDDHANRGNSEAGVNIQLTRSCTAWSSGHPTEHSIANAYISAIRNARHFVYIENQFFITATGDKQRPVENKIGAAIVERILRAHAAGEEFKIIVLMPAVPAFAGDLKSDGALGTRAIMEFQYNSINRGGHSIIESLKKQGVEDVSRYIGFYNLRNYDRINVSATMHQAERNAGVSYEQARREADDRVGHGNQPYGSTGDDQYRRYQEAARHVEDVSWDTVTSCYMEGGQDINRVPWIGTHNSDDEEMRAFVSEELYIHSKVLIADDRLVICGSANLNDRSQLGTHDSEIAVVIEDPDLVESEMGGQPYQASRFAASLRRQLTRKHLGLLPDQRWDRPNANWTPVSRGPNQYDWGVPADRLVRDPLSRGFDSLWRRTARENTEVFDKVFHPVPSDKVRTWRDYDRWFSRHFIIPGADKDKDKDQNDEGKASREGKVEYGHVVPEEFPGGAAEVKQWLGRVRGTLVEMPLEFLIEVEDLAKEGLSLNSITDVIYT